MSILRPATAAAFLISVLFALGAGAATVSGTVSGAGGVRLQGKIVEAYDLSGVLRGTATTDAAGTYVLSLIEGQYRLLAYDPLGTYATVFYPNAEGFDVSPALTVREGSPLRADFTLPLGGTVTGTVTSATAPLANAVVEIYNLSGTRRGFTRTNAAGEFSLVVPTGDYKLFAYDASEFYAGEFYSNERAFSEAQTLRVTAGAPQSIGFILDRAAHASGSVVDAVTRLGISGMLVYAYTADGKLVATTTTNAQGGFRFTLQGGQYRFVAGDPARVYGPSFWVNARSFAQAEVVTLTPGLDRVDIYFAAERAAIISGRVSQSGTMVTVYNLDGTVHAQTFPNSFGEYSLAVAPGQYKIAAVGFANVATEFHRDTPDFNAAQVITVSSGQTLTIDFDPPRAGRFTGTVRDAATQQPLSGMTVAAYDASGVRVAETTTAANGTYTLLVAPGEYRVLVFDARLEYATSFAPAPLAVTVDNATPLDFTMRRGTRVSGTVLSANGAAVGGAEVLAFDLAGNPAGGATTRADGTFTLVVLPGTYTFVARTRFSSATVGPVDVGAVSPAPVGIVLDGSARRRAARH